MRALDVWQAPEFFFNGKPFRTTAEAGGGRTDQGRQAQLEELVERSSAGPADKEVPLQIASFPPGWVSVRFRTRYPPARRYCFRYRKRSEEQWS